MTDPLIMSEMTPDESLEPCSLLERWESEEGYDYLSFGDFIAMATQAAKKAPVEAPATPESIDIGDLTILNEKTSGCIGLMYVTQEFIDGQQSRCDWLAVQSMNNLLWIYMVSTDGDDIPSFEQANGKKAVANCPDLYVFEGGFRQEDGTGQCRVSRSFSQMKLIMSHSGQYLRGKVDLKSLKSVGVVPTLSRGGAFQEAVKNYQAWKAKSTTTTNTQEVAKTMEARAASAEMEDAF